jgi:hypothetical protein
VSRRCSTVGDPSAYYFTRCRELPVFRFGLAKNEQEGTSLSMDKQKENGKRCQRRLFPFSILIPNLMVTLPWSIAVLQAQPRLPACPRKPYDANSIGASFAVLRDTALPSLTFPTHHRSFLL